MGHEMPRQPQLHGAIQVVGHAAQQRLFALLPIAARGDGPATPALDDRHARLSGKGLARIREDTAYQWPPRSFGGASRAGPWNVSSPSS